MTDKVALITGVGGATGAALVRRFASGGYRVAMLARNAARLAALAREIDGASAFPCDVEDRQALAEAVAAVRLAMGAPTVVVHNAVAATFGQYDTLSLDAFESSFRINAVALLHLAQALAPDMVARGERAFADAGYAGNRATHATTMRSRSSASALSGCAFERVIARLGRNRRLTEDIQTPIVRSCHPPCLRHPPASKPHAVHTGSASNAQGGVPSAFVRPRARSHAGGYEPFRPSGHMSRLPHGFRP